MSQGFIVPLSSETICDIPQQLIMLSDIINSCWDACVSRDSYESNTVPFRANAIISNPVTYGHLHCAGNHFYN